MIQKKFLNQACGLNNDGSMPIEDRAFRSRAAMADGAAKPAEQIPAGTRTRKVNLVSQRKLFRVKKWNGLQQRDGYSKQKIRKEGLEKFEDHDFIILTDSEEFVKEDIELLEGVHHLTD